MHEYFDDLRSKDSDYDEDHEEISHEGEETLGNGNDSSYQFGGNKRIISPEMINARQRTQGHTVNSSNLVKNNKNSFSQASHGGTDVARRSDINYNNINNNNMKNTQMNSKNNTSQQNMMKSNNSGLMNLGSAGDPLH